MNSDCGKKLTAIFLCICLNLSDSLFYTLPSLRASEGGAAISIPPELGTLEESSSAPRSTNHETPAAKTILYIQDAHDSLEAQENIAKIINHLVEHQGVKTVFEEGYEGPVPTDEYFGFIKDPRIKEKVSYFLLDKLRIGGAEYAHINRFYRLSSPHILGGDQRAGSPTDPPRILADGDDRKRVDFKLIGADNFKLHLENIEWYRESAKHKKETSNDLETIGREIKRLADQYFPKELKEWMKLKERSDEGKLDLLNYLRRTSALNPKNRFFTPNISLLLGAEDEKEEKVNKVESIDPKALFREIDLLENDFARPFLKRGRDQKLFRYYKGLELLKRLNEIQLTSSEYEMVKGRLKELNTEEFAHFIVKNTNKSIVLSKRWEENIQKAIRFYEIAAARDFAVEARIDEFVKSDEPVSILIFGGFHKNRIQEILKSKGVSLFVISPKITKIDTRHQELYRRFMSEGYALFPVTPNVAKAARLAGEIELATVGGPTAKSELRAYHHALNRTIVRLIRDQPVVLNSSRELFHRLIEERVIKKTARDYQPKNSNRRSEVRMEGFPLSEQDIIKQVQRSPVFNSLLKQFYLDGPYLSNEKDIRTGMMTDLMVLFRQFSSREFNLDEAIAIILDVAKVIPRSEMRIFSKRELTGMLKTGDYSRLREYLETGSFKVEDIVNLFEMLHQLIEGLLPSGLVDRYRLIDLLPILYEDYDAVFKMKDRPRLDSALSPLIFLLISNTFDLAVDPQAERPRQVMDFMSAILPSQPPAEAQEPIRFIPHRSPTPRSIPLINERMDPPLGRKKMDLLQERPIGHLRNQFRKIWDNPEDSYVLDRTALLAASQAYREILNVPSLGSEHLGRFEKALFSPEKNQVLIALSFFSNYSKTGITDRPELVSRLKEIFESEEFADGARITAFLALRMNAIAVRRLFPDFFQSTWDNTYLDVLHRSTIELFFAGTRLKASQVLSDFLQSDYHQLKWLYPFDYVAFEIHTQAEKFKAPPPLSKLDMIYFYNLFEQFGQHLDGSEIQSLYRRLVEETRKQGGRSEVRTGSAVNRESAIVARKGPDTNHEPRFTNDGESRSEVRQLASPKLQQSGPSTSDGGETGDSLEFQTAEVPRESVLTDRKVSPSTKGFDEFPSGDTGKFHGEKLEGDSDDIAASPRFNIIGGKVEANGLPNVSKRRRARPALRPTTLKGGDRRYDKSVRTFLKYNFQPHDEQNDTRRLSERQWIHDLLRSADQAEFALRPRGLLPENFEREKEEHEKWTEQIVRKGEAKILFSGQSLREDLELARRFIAFLRTQEEGIERLSELVVALNDPQFAHSPDFMGIIKRLEKAFQRPSVPSARDRNDLIKIAKAFLPRSEMRLPLDSEALGREAHAAIRRLRRFIEEDKIIYFNQPAQAILPIRIAMIQKKRMSEKEIERLETVFSHIGKSGSLSLRDLEVLTQGIKAIARLSRIRPREASAYAEEFFWLVNLRIRVVPAAGQLQLLIDIGDGLGSGQEWPIWAKTAETLVPQLLAPQPSDETSAFYLKPPPTDLRYWHWFEPPKLEGERIVITMKDGTAHRFDFKSLIENPRARRNFHKAISQSLISRELHLQSAQDKNLLLGRSEVRLDIRGAYEGGVVRANREIKQIRLRQQKKLERQTPFLRHQSSKNPPSSTLKRQDKKIENNKEYTTQKKDRQFKSRGRIDSN